MSHTLSHGSHLGRYRLIRKLGDGGTSMVYLGHDPLFDREVVIKVFKQSFLDDPKNGKQNRRQLEIEAGLAGKLAHPNIVTTYEAFISDSKSYIVMEYVPGGTLEKHIQPDNLLPLDRVVEYMFKCCRALNYAQFNGVIHRDIKPANLLLCNPDEIKIADLGAAVRVDLEETQNSVGSPNYMSPEQVRGDEITHSTDIYSLGVVMYRLLTGRSPYRPKSLAHLYQLILNEKPPLPTKLRKDLPPQLERIVMIALEKDPAKRFATWRDFGNELAALGHFEKSDLEIGENEKFTALRKLKMFQDFSDIELWELLRVGEWQKQPAKTILLREGELGDAFYVLTNGGVTVSRNNRLLNTLNSGSIIGEMSYTSRKQMPRSASITATTEITVMKILPSQLDQLSDRCQLHFNQVFLSTLADRLRVSDERVAQMMSNTTQNAG
ncbi:serine/threonine-protein kinase [Sideroxydans lithotrophicus]|uniref:Cyclic nucleotide-binding protein n=1 Tax=Sideroxydans lithotrophicus (strain ES-1) TaxID=580332 RepID=D5CLG6_SIDLE|nr:serine/threonine-protein kinase [Sideroxydans lithotrophicus]ADE10554.1 cyclic nucleotide-binding protein [Sideroxydans lithotrophicus ES-1]